MNKKPPKLYELGQPLSVSEANRLLGLPRSSKMTWDEFQEYAKRKLLSTHAQISK